jgi:DNA helicase II / ATP-dependent DNA helicase PcrA
MPVPVRQNRSGLRCGVNKERATGGVSQPPAITLDFLGFPETGQGGGQTGQDRRTRTGITSPPKTSIIQFLNPGFITSYSFTAYEPRQKHKQFSCQTGSDMDLSSLNPSQLEAVEYFDGPLLVLAGAGSGKTRVLTCKIARILETGRARPWEVLAMTFTNKAAGEMRRRVSSLVPGDGDRVKAGTFHSICAWLLRREAHHLGFSENFTIYDADDQKVLIRKLMKAREMTSGITPGQARDYISRKKNEGVAPENALLEEVSSLRDADLAGVYQRYQTELRNSGAMDFDDLLTSALDLIRQNSDIRATYSGRFAYILVDEYQDTNRVQHQFLRELSGEGRGVCVVGDDDQSIYAWRGACIENILGFPDEFPGTRLVRLEENYRSTGNILRGAAALVRNNSRRHGKTLWTRRDDGEPIRVRLLASEVDEAQWIVGEIVSLIATGGCPSDSVAVLYRTNAQSRQFETACRKHGLNYEVVGSQRFYERAEIKDITAYLRLLLNHSDRVSLERVINRPSRGLGRKGLAAFLGHVDRTGIDPFEAMEKISGLDGVSTRAAMELTRLASWYRVTAEGLLVTGTAAAVVDSLLQNVDILQMYDPGEVTDQARLENIAEFRRSVVEYDAEFPEGGLPGFMTEVSLATSVDEYEGQDSGKIALMTLHCAKGLEFHTVFIAGLEEGMLPFVRPGDYASSDMEEERRLLYVGMTRAMNGLVLTWIQNRIRPGVRQSGPSRFLSEIAGGTHGIGPAAPMVSVVPRECPPGAVERSVPESAESYARGDVIRHPRYGRGLVTAVLRRGDEWQITVDFGMDEPKTLVTGYVPIPVIKHRGTIADLD